MPTYEFRCSNGHEFERFYRKISDAAAELPCPECGAVAGRQLSAGAGLLFKGSGFYLTDYGKNAHRKTGPAAGGAKSGEGKPEAAGGEAKSGDAKSGDAKSGDTKGSGDKTAEKSTAPSKPSGSSGGDKS
ncbi:MAG: FmdB family zinc ribbon protein [Gemmatimonadaceae bacterium]